MDDNPVTERPAPDRRAVLRDANVVGFAVGVYGLAFGVAAVTAGLSWGQASALSLLMFTGGSQFALVGVLGAGGGAVAAVTVAVVLGLRNGLYGLRLAALLPARAAARVAAAQLVIDESMAMASSRDDPPLARLAFWATGLSVFFWWNLATVIGALGAVRLGDPRVIGFDAVFPAAFLALTVPLVRGRPELLTALFAAVLTVVLIPLTPPGVPVMVAIVAAIPALVAGEVVRRRRP